MSGHKVLRGQCLCKSVTYEITTDTGYKPMTAFCHCSNCRTSSGSIGTYNAMYPLDAFKVTSEQQPVKYYDSNSISGNTNIRCFCGKCGSAIITISEKKKLAIMKVPTLEDQSGFVPQVEIFTKTKKDWEPEHYSESAKQFSENAQ